MARFAADMPISFPAFFASARKAAPPRPPSHGAAPAMAESTGFTLIELVLAMGIAMIILSFAVPAANNILQGSQLTQSGHMIGDQLNLARQTAISKNHPVEVRFYQFADSGEKSGSPGAGKFRAMQVFDIKETGAAVPLGKVQRFPSSMIIDSGNTLSTLLAPSLQKSWINPADAPVNIPGVGTTYQCRAFRFLPGGSTNLLQTSSSPWFLTLHSLRDGDNLTSPPHDFVTFQIDPNNGHIRTFRP